jgi:hypothetical protein
VSSEDEAKRTLKAIQQSRKSGGGRTGRLSTLAQSDYLTKEKRDAIADILWGSEVTRLDTWVKLALLTESITIIVLYTIVVVLLLR